MVLKRKKTEQGNAQAVKSRTYRKMAFNGSMMTDIQPVTPNQERLFEAWAKGKKLMVFKLSHSRVRKLS